MCGKGTVVQDLLVTFSSLTYSYCFKFVKPWRFREKSQFEDKSIPGECTWKGRELL